jgi:hypothetical protein
LFAEEKMELIKLHKSQFKQRCYQECACVQAAARYLGIQAGQCTFAESLKAITDPDWSAGEF